MYVVKDTKVANPSAIAKGAGKAANKQKKRREVLSADAQNRKIAELEGMLVSYDKSSMSSHCIVNRRKTPGGGER
jgi:hypothetical protein